MLNAVRGETAAHPGRPGVPGRPDTGPVGRRLVSDVTGVASPLRPALTRHMQTP